MKGVLFIAIYHLSIKIITRGKGRSAVASAAYRAGEKIKNERDGVTHDYTRKSGVVHTEILLPDNAPDEYKNRATLWNAVEKIEKAKNSQLAREIQIALPIEFTEIQNRSLVREYVKKNFVAHGMIADISIHNSDDGNPHVHIMLTMRPFAEDKTWGAKSRKEYILDGNGEKIRLNSGEYKSRKISATDWNEQTKAEEWRESWADILNKYLEKLGHADRVDHRSLERQGVERIPSIHLGVAAHQMEQRGIATERGDINRAIEITNQQIQELEYRIAELRDWLDSKAVEVVASPEPQNLADIIQDTLAKRGQVDSLSHSVTPAKQENISKMLKFLQSHNILDLDGLHDVVMTMHKKLNAVRDDLKRVEPKSKELTEHIKQAGRYREHSEIYKMYTRQKPKDKEQFYESFRMQLTLYEAAKRHLSKHLNSKGAIPLSSWEKELKELTSEKKKLYRDYEILKVQMAEVEKFKGLAEDVLREEVQRAQPVRSYSVER